jgi:hypothetical protein
MRCAVCVDGDAQRCSLYKKIVWPKGKLLVIHGNTPSRFEIVAGAADDAIVPCDTLRVGVAFIDSSIKHFRRRVEDI